MDDFEDLVGPNDYAQQESNLRRRKETRWALTKFLHDNRLHGDLVDRHARTMNFFYKSPLSPAQLATLATVAGLIELRAAGELGIQLVFDLPRVGETAHG